MSASGGISTRVMKPIAAKSNPLIVSVPIIMVRRFHLSTKTPA